MEKVINPHKLFIGAFTPNWLLSRKEISPEAKLCYARLCQFAGRQGVAYPKLETLAKEIGCSISRVQKALNNLLEYKIIKKKRIGLQAANRYYFLYHVWMDPENISEDPEGISPSNNLDCSGTHNQDFHDISEGLDCSGTHNQDCAGTNNHKERESKERESHMFTGTKVPDSGINSAELKNKVVKKRKLIKKIKPCSSGEIKKSDLIRKALNGERLVSKPIITKPRKHKVRVPNNVQDVVDYWSRKGLPVHKPDTKSFALAVRYIKELYEGTLFNGMKNDYYHNRKFLLREIKFSIDNFVLALSSNEHMPVNKSWLKKVTLSQFFYNPRSIKHPFLQYLAKPERVVNSKIFQYNDWQPEVTKVLLDWWDRFEESRFPLTVQVTNNCILAGKKLKNFYEENKNRFLWGTHGNQIVILAQKLTECLDKELRENESLYAVFDSRWLVSDRTFNERLPKYLISANKMRSSMGGEAPKHERESVFFLKDKQDLKEGHKRYLEQNKRNSQNNRG